MKDIAEKVKAECQRIMIGLNKDESHNWNHPLRVRKLALQISSGLDLNPDLLRMMVYLHDIGRVKAKGFKGNRTHAQFSYEMAILILEKFDIPEKELILQAVLQHDELNDSDDSIYLKVLKDADRLDCMGAIAVYRCIHATSNKEEFLEDLENSLSYFSMLRIPAAISIGKPRHDFLVHFRRLFLQES